MADLNLRDEFAKLCAKAKRLGLLKFEHAEQGIAVLEIPATVSAPAAVDRSPSTEPAPAAEPAPL